MSPTPQIGQIDGRPVVDRAGVRALIGKSATAVDRYITTTQAHIRESAATATALPPLPPFPAPAGTRARRRPGPEVDVWFADQVADWWQQYEQARAARRTLVDRSGAPDELVDLEEAAIVCGYDDARSITGLLKKMPHSRFPPPTTSRRPGSGPACSIAAKRCGTTATSAAHAAVHVAPAPMTR